MAIIKPFWNTAVMVLVAIPPVVVTYMLQCRCREVVSMEWVCQTYLKRPVTALNLLWFAHVDITFFIISMLQGSTWLIDPYWTLAPPMLALFWLTHPTTAPWNARQATSTALIFLWAVRLTHSYFRREKWQVGLNEDWRYAEMRVKYGRFWPFVQVTSSPHDV